MSSTLTNEQTEAIVSAYLSGNYSIEAEVEKLVQAGMDRAVAEQKVKAVVDYTRQRVFANKVKTDARGEIRKVTGVVTIMVAAIGPVFETSSVLWYTAAAVIAGVAGYFGYKDKPAAGITASVLVVLLFPLMYGFYFNNRTSYIRIELVIPLLLAIVPAWLVYLLITKIFYTDTDI